MTRLSYSRGELLAQPAYSARTRKHGVLCHGGRDARGTYVSPRSLHRPAAIRAWTEELAAAGHPTEAMRFERPTAEFFPSAEQAKVLLKAGASGAMTRILTL